MFKVMTGNFGIDGLISSHSVFHGDTPDECWRWLYRQQEAAPNRFYREEYYIMWVEEHTDPNDDNSGVRINDPYPQVHKPEAPEWYIETINKLHIERNAA